MKFKTMVSKAKDSEEYIRVKLVSKEQLSTEEIYELGIEKALKERYFLVATYEDSNALVFPKFAMGYKSILSAGKAFRHYVVHNKKSSALLHPEDVDKILAPVERHWVAEKGKKLNEQLVQKGEQ